MVNRERMRPVIPKQIDYEGDVKRWWDSADKNERRGVFQYLEIPVDIALLPFSEAREELDLEDFKDIYDTIAPTVI